MRIKSTLLTVKDLFVAFRGQGLTVAWVLVSVVFVLSCVFVFLSHAPVLSPFVYPLF